MEIKFRAWVVNEYEEDGNTPKSFGMVNWHEHFFSDMSCVTGWSSEFPDKDSNEVILMHYIGPKDKNGKDYYEKDIVKLPDCSIYHILSFADIWYDIGYSDGTLENELKNGEIIGNSLENKELLEKQ